MKKVVLRTNYGMVYKEGFERIDRGLKEERYFEVVCICDSIINDRLTSLIQTLKNDEG